MYKGSMHRKSFTRLSNQFEFQGIQVTGQSQVKNGIEMVETRKYEPFEAKFFLVDAIDLFQEIPPKIDLYLEEKFTLVNGRIYSSNFFRLFIKDSRQVLVEEFSVRNKEELFKKTLEVRQRLLLSFEKLEKSLKNAFMYNHCFVRLPPKASGFFVHEILGHALEQDFFVHLPNELKRFSFPNELILEDRVDDYEFVIGVSENENTTLIRDGKILRSLTSKRRESFEHCLLYRMSGTRLCNVKKTVKIQSEIPLVMTNAVSGLFNPHTLEFEVSGYGEYQGKFVRNMKMKGNLLRTLSNIQEIYTDNQVTPGECLKSNQIVKVAMDAPTIDINIEEVSGIR